MTTTDTDSKVTSLEIKGGQVVYELLGPENGELIVLTPGGRFSKDVPGLRPLAEQLVAGGMQVLLWDRPNCGRSDVQFYGRTESHMRAETLAGLLQALGVGPVIIAGGSGGARDSLLTAMLYPELAKKVAVWSIVGGVYSTMNLAGVYVLPNLGPSRVFGMEGVANLPEWSALIKANPRNRERLLTWDLNDFQSVMLRWLNAFVPKPGQTIPGVDDELFARIQVPTLIVRGGRNDWDHPARTSYEVHSLIQQSALVEPPWPEDAWERAVESAYKGTGNIFDPWVQAAPLLLDFASP